jgi:hypothetical protein
MPSRGQGLGQLVVEAGFGELTAVGRRAFSSSRGSKPSRGHSIASGLVTNPRCRVRSGDAAGSRDGVAASVDELLAGLMPQPPYKP